MNKLEFIEKYKNEDVNNLRLKFSSHKFDFDMENALLQIECRRKYYSKLSHFFLDNAFVFPDAISGEQASHQAVAKFHATLLKADMAILDMTAGLGIDSLSFASIAKYVTMVEIDKNKSEALAKNAHILEKKNIKVINSDSLDFLKGYQGRFDVIFIDPARRDSFNKRVYNLKDCSPDITSIQNLLSSHTDRVFIKASPLLDITKTIKDLMEIKSLRAIGVKGECKELLIELDYNTLKKDNATENVVLQAVDLDNKGNVISEFTTSFTTDQMNFVVYAESNDLQPGFFILEPSAMMMKLSPWGEICNRFQAKKMANSSHLFVSPFFPESFPGRVTRFVRIIKKNDRKSLKGLPASVVSRNHPQKAEDLRKSLLLKEGDKNFIYATRIGEKPIIFQTSVI